MQSESQFDDWLIQHGPPENMFTIPKDWSYTSHDTEKAP